MAYRRDTRITRDIPGYRKILNLLTPSRTHASVYFTQTLDLTRTLPWLEAQAESAGRRVNFLHLFIASAGRMLHDRPRLNRYVAGAGFWQRDGVTISVSAKKSLNDGAKVVLLKLPVEAGDGAVQVAERFSGMLGAGREKDTATEKEVDFFLHLPAFVLRPLIKVLQWLDGLHLLPSAFVDPDPLFTSLVVANLGSVGLDAAYHHLYEWGNCPLFGVIGRIHDRPYQTDDGGTEWRPSVEIKWAFDERVTDGLATAIAMAGFQELVEDPASWASGYTQLGDAPPERVSAT